MVIVEGKLAKCILMAKEFEKARNELKRALLIPFPELVKGAEHYARLIGVAPERYVIGRMLYCVNRLEDIYECAPNWEKKMKPLLKDLRKSIIDRDFARASDILEEIGIIQEKEAPI